MKPIQAISKDALVGGISSPKRATFSGFRTLREKWADAFPGGKLSRNIDEPSDDVASRSAEVSPTSEGIVFHI